MIESNFENRMITSTPMKNQSGGSATYTAVINNTKNYFMKAFLRRTGPFSIALAFIFLVASSAQAQRTASVSGNWSNTATWGGQAVPTSADAVTINSGITVTVDITANCASLSFLSTATVNSNVNINSGITLNVVGAVTIPRQANNINTLAIGGGILNAGSILFTNSGGGQRHVVSITTGTANITGNIDAGNNATGSATIIFNSPGTGTINLGGAFFSTGTGTFTHADNASTVNFNGSVAQTIPNNTYNFNNIQVNNAAGATLGGNETATNVTGNVSVQTGTLNNGGFSMALASGKNFTVASGANFNLTGTSTMATVTGGGTKTFGATSTVSYNGTAQTVSAETYGKLVLGGSGNKTFAGTTTIAGNLSITGAVALLANGTTSTANTLTLGGTGQPAGSWGGTSSSATNKNSTFFGTTTTGILNVTNSSCPAPTITGTLSVCAGSTTQLSGSGTPAASNPWASSNTGVATVGNTGLVTGVSGGTSVITYTNSTGCSNTATVTVNATASTSFTKTDVQCFNTSTGQIVVTAVGGASPYTYSIDNGTNYLNNGGTFNGLSGGTYKIRVKDSNGCESKAVF